MKGSLHLATVASIPVKVHWSFGLLLLFFIFINVRGGLNLFAILFSLLVVLGVFFCVILHEFGHALVARRYGVKTYDIIMTPIGGIARLETMPQGRLQEFWVAIAGPTVNFVIVGLIWMAFYLFDGRVLPLFSSSFWQLENQPPSFFVTIMLANIYLGAFNLLPAFPMDGGRMLRSLLSLRLDRLSATKIASAVGQGVAVIMFGLGLWAGNPILTLIGVFIFFAARQENRIMRQQTLLKTTTALSLMKPIDHLLFKGQSMADARNAISRSPETAFVVWAFPSVVAGYITRDRILQQPPIPPDAIIDPWIIPSPVVVHKETTAEALLALFRNFKVPLILIAENGHYIGLITREKLADQLR